MNKTKNNTSHPDRPTGEKDPVEFTQTNGILAPSHKATEAQSRSGYLRMTIYIIGIFLIILLASIIFLLTKQGRTISTMQSVIKQPIQPINPLSIEYMRKQQYPGSDITIEETLPAGSNYQRYVVSYKSEGLKIYALLTVPNGDTPASGWPVIIFNHGYIPPAQYRTTERYLDYTDAFSRNGYIVLKSDYRGHGSSEGNPTGAYYSPAYTIDVLNAVSSIKKYPGADPNRIGMWGHSMGGSITLRSMVVTKDIKAGVIWAGVVADYKDMATNWHRARPFMPSQREQAVNRPGRQSFINQYGAYDANPTFWHSIAPIYFVKDISGPIQIHHGTADEEVPLLFSERLDSALKQAGKPVEMFTYEGDDHNISQNVNIALQRSVDFFDKYLSPRVIPTESADERRDLW